MKLKAFAYKALKLSNDINAVKKDKVGKRIEQRLLAKLFWRLFR